MQNGSHPGGAPGSGPAGPGGLPSSVPTHLVPLEEQVRRHHVLPMLSLNSQRRLVSILTRVQAIAGPLGAACLARAWLGTEGSSQTQSAGRRRGARKGMTIR
jgi:hypothetical protein